MNAKIDHIRDCIANFHVEGHYEPNDMIRLLALMEELAVEMERIEMRLQRYIELGPAAAITGKL